MRVLLRITFMTIAIALLGDGSHEQTRAGSLPSTGGPAGTEILRTATFAGGCFWCMEPPFDALPGVRSTLSGYSGGTVPNPSYDMVSEGTTGHVEAVQIVYDASQLSYAKLLDVFWRNVDPLSDDGQFCDRGSTYRSVIFYHGEEQRRLAEESKQTLVESGRFNRPIVTKILPASPFYPAETYHQDYYQNHPFQYKFYRTRCGRDARLTELWGKTSH